MPAKSHPLRDRFAIAAMFSANGMASGIWAILIPGLLPRFGITSFQLGLLILALGFGAISVMPLAGRLISDQGPARVTIGFALPLLIALPLVALAPDLWVLTLAIVALGMTMGGMDVAMNSCAVAAERRHGRAIMSASHGFWSLGGFIGAGAGAVISAGAGPILATLGATACMAGLILAAGTYLLRWFGPEPQAVQAPSRHLLPRDLGVWVLGLMALAAMIPEGAVLDWAAIYMQRELGSDPVRAGLAFALFSGAMAVMRFSGDIARARLGAVRALRVSGLIGALGLGLAALGMGEVLTIAGFMLAGLGIANMVPVLFSAAGNQPGMAPATGLSLVTMIGYSGILAAPGLIGILADHVALASIFGVLSILLLIVAGLAPRARAAEFRP